MSKKRFDHEKLDHLKSISDHIDLNKAKKFADTITKKIIVGQTELFLQNVTNSSFYLALVFQNNF